MKFIKTAGKIAFLVVIIFSALLKKLDAQLVNDGSNVTITAGAIVYTQASFTNTANGTVVNSGTITADSNIVNDNGASLSGNGTYSMQGNFSNTGIFNEDSSVLNFYGAANSTIKNAGGKIYELLVNKDVNRTVSLLDNETILSSVSFLSDKNWININSKTLSLTAKCKIVGFSNKRYFLTSGSGFLKKGGLHNTPFTFPVGFDKSTYNPLTITENGTADAYSVRCLEHAYLQGSAGNAITTKGIDASWEIKEVNAGGANAVIEAQWKTSDELTSFDYTKCMVVRYAANGWDFKAADAGVATGNTYRVIARSNLSSFGYFTVLSNKNPTFAVAALKESDLAVAENKTMQFKIYPTLVQNYFNIQVPFSNKAVQKMNISVIDGNGKVVWQKQNADYGDQKISIPNFPSGMYNVLIESGENRFVQKIIIGK